VEELLAFDNEEFVQNAYRCLFRREPDSGGFEYHREVLRSGEMSKLDILRRLVSSEEGRQNAVQIVGLDSQESVENRQTDPDVGKGVMLRPTATRRTLVNRAPRSIEEFDDLSDKEFVLTLYRVLLNQETQPEIAANWEDMLSRGSLSRWDIALALAGSAEGKAAGAPVLAPREASNCQKQRLVFPQSSFESMSTPSPSIISNPLSL
jgi:hypothetical protein